MWLKSIGLENWELSQNYIFVFDLTVAEVRQAAADGCTLCGAILCGGQANILETSFLAASVRFSSVTFGVPVRGQWSVGIKSIGSETSMANCFKLLAASGMFNKSPGPL